MTKQSLRSVDGTSATFMDDDANLPRRVSRLIHSAARHLGLDESSAGVASQTATLVAGNKTVLVVPMGEDEGAEFSLLLSVQTTIPVEHGACKEAASAVEILQHAPAALHALSASIASTPDGCWSVCRSVTVDHDGGASLAAYLIETVQLTDFVLQKRVDRTH